MSSIEVWICFPHYFFLVPGLLCHLLTVGVAWISQIFGKVQFRSIIFWRTLLESPVWKNGQDSWSGKEKQVMNSISDTFISTKGPISKVPWIPITQMSVIASYYCIMSHVLGAGLSRLRDVIVISILKLKKVENKNSLIFVTHFFCVPNVFLTRNII